MVYKANVFNICDNKKMYLWIIQGHESEILYTQLISSKCINTFLDIVLWGMWNAIVIKYVY